MNNLPAERVSIPFQLLGCLRLPVADLAELYKRRKFWIVYALRKYSRVKALRYETLKTVEKTNPGIITFFLLYIVALDDHNIDYHICVDDVNLTPETFRYTNNFCFLARDDADYYEQLCKDFDIQSEFTGLR